MTTMRQLIGQLNEVASNAEMDVAKQAISKAQALVGVAGELASRAGRNGDKKMEMAANKAADAAGKLVKEAQRWARGSAGKTVETYTVGGGRQVTVPEDDK